MPKISAYFFRRAWRTDTRLIHIIPEGQHTSENLGLARIASAVAGISASSAANGWDWAVAQPLGSDKSWGAHTTMAYQATAHG